VTNLITHIAEDKVLSLIKYGMYKSFKHLSVMDLMIVTRVALSYLGGG